MKIPDENILEPIIRYFRYRESIKYINKNKPVVIVDLGCGYEIGFYEYAIKHGIIFKQYIGIDPLINKMIIKKYKNNPTIKLIQNPINETILLNSKTVDYVIGLAFLEHLDNPQNMLPDIIRILKKEGLAIFTTPTKKARGILEFLSFKVGIISKSLMEEHKNYFNREEILDLLRPYQSKIEFTHKYFELDYNNLILIKKVF